MQNIPNTEDQEQKHSRVLRTLSFLLAMILMVLAGELSSFSRAGRRTRGGRRADEFEFEEIRPLPITFNPY